MKRDWMVSGAIAAAFHAGLLFGIRPSHAAIPQDRVCVLDGPPGCVFPLPEPLPLDFLVEDEPSWCDGPPRPVIEQFAPVVPPVSFEVDVSPVPSDGRFRPEPLIPCCFFWPEPMAALDRTAPLRASELDRPPLARVKSRPAYPFSARRAGLSGEVMVEFEVDEGGAVAGARVAGSTAKVFEAAALDAVAKWKFEPGKKDGRPVRFRMAVPMVFSLGNE